MLKYQELIGFLITKNAFEKCVKECSFYSDSGMIKVHLRQCNKEIRRQEKERTYQHFQVTELLYFQAINIGSTLSQPLH
jgi:hypothetical protein